MGYHSVWLDDHLMYETQPILECWTALAALSAVTKRIHLGSMVTCNSFRNPALLAKMAATLDVISGGRLELGIGAGVQETEHFAYGFPFPKTAIRIERLREAVEVIKALWAKEEASYTGKHYSISGAVCMPKPLQKPHPPITIGGSGEKLLLKVTAQHADRCDFGYVPSLEMYKHKLKVLEKHCSAVDRDFQEIEKSCWLGGQVVIARDCGELRKRVECDKPNGLALDVFKRTSIIGTPDECIEQMQPYVDLGVTHFMLYFGGLPNFSGLRLFAETVAHQYVAE